METENNIYNVLIIDDDPITLELIKGMLTEEPVKTFTAPCFDDGYKIFSEYPIDIVFSDFNLPDKSGIDVLDKFNKQRREIPIILMTANPKDDFLLKALKKGAFDILVKPCHEFDLNVLLHKAMDRRDLQKELAQYRSKKFFFKDALNHAHEGIIIYNENLSIVDFNKTISKTLGISKKLLDSEDSILPSGLIEESKSENILKTLKQQKHFTYQHYYRNSEGEKVSCLSHLTFAKIAGSNYVIDIVVFDN